MKLKNSLEELNSKFEPTEESINKLKINWLTFEMIQYEEKKVKNKNKINKT